MLERIIESLGSNFHLVLVLDNVDLSASPHVSSILEFFRSLYDQRNIGVLSRLTVVTTSVRDITLNHAGLVSPFNVSKKVYLNDLTRPESDQLIGNIFARNDLVSGGGVEELLFMYAHGVAYLLQSIISLIDDQEGEISASHVYRAVVAYLKKAPGVFRFSGRSPLNDDAMSCLLALLRDDPILPYETTPGLMELVSLGYVALNTDPHDDYYRIRCQIIKLILVNIYYPLPHNPSLRFSERLVSQFPPVKLLLLNARFFQEITEAVFLALSKEPSDKSRQAMLRQTVQTTLESTDIPIDYGLYREMFSQHVHSGDSPHDSPDSCLKSIVSHAVNFILKPTTGDRQ